MSAMGQAETPPGACPSCLSIPLALSASSTRQRRDPVDESGSSLWAQVLAEGAESLPPWLAARIFEQSEDGIVVTDTANRIIAVNHAYCSLTGYARADLIGENIVLPTYAHNSEDVQSDFIKAVTPPGFALGETMCCRQDGSMFPASISTSALRDATGTITHYAVTVVDRSASNKADREVLHRAQHDPLTGLANRDLLQDRLLQAIASARRSGEQFAVLFLDLDRFKNINDSLGQVAGDVILKRAAQRLRQCVREEDTLARVGGDEFVLVLRDIKDARGPVAVARKISHQLYEPFHFEGREFSLTSSIGISLYPDDGGEGQSLIDRAATAMVRAKERGQNSYAFYRPTMTKHIQERLLLEQSLHRALERNELVLFYQPQLDVASGRITGGEALLRWRHPQLGLIAPDRFIAVAEQTGLIRPIGAWVLRAVCAQMTAWRKAGLTPLRMAVNLSGHQILRSKHVEALRSVLAECWAPTDGLELEIEITESALQTSENAVASACLLKSLGITLAIDDFGTGYSSMMALKLLPIDRLKIDRSFTEGTPDNANHASVTAAVIAMGKALGLKVLAEGVETAQQLAFLRERGCDEAQGYLIGRPLPAAEFEHFLHDARRGDRY
jgi:diguanylate cyclase (GGDEF)-like protein/PAS domain S-box-containing protein